MDNKKSVVVIILVAVVLFLGSQSVYTVDQTQRGLLLQLGKPVDSGIEPGLHFKLPFVQNVIRFDKRVLEYDAPPAEILTRDKKNLVVDNYSRWRISDTLDFYQTARTVSGGRSRLDDIIYSELRVALGNFSLTEIVSAERSEIMSRVTEKSREKLSDYGIEVLDVRIKRTDLPEENQKAIFGRMRAERERQAKRYRAEGREEGVKVKTGADRERAVMLADAREESQVLRGEGDAEATGIYAQALSKDPEFYQFWKSMEAYKQGVNNGTDFVFTPREEFWRYMESSK
ncbi:MAG: protease modulator HflC [Desulfonatronovibrionaceae bacterium]